MASSRRLLSVEMKTRRAQEHFNALQRELDKWLNLPPYTIVHKSDFEKCIDIWSIKGVPMPEIVPMLLGDFVCCLRSALDHLAWQLAHLEMREFTERELREIQFPVARLDDGKYRHTLSLFPSTVTDDIDELQPYHRGDGEEYRDDLLWQLSELWRIDKHRLIAINSNSYNVGFPLPVEMWQPFIKHFDHTIEVQLPLGLSWTCPVDLEPTVSVEVLFGEYMGELCISRERLGEINQFVRDTVIPRFARFFP